MYNYIYNEDNDDSIDSITVHSTVTEAQVQGVLARIRGVVAIIGGRVFESNSTSFLFVFYLLENTLQNELPRTFSKTITITMHVDHRSLKRISCAPGSRVVAVPRGLHGAPVLCFLALEVTVRTRHQDPSISLVPSQSRHFMALFLP